MISQSLEKNMVKECILVKQQTMMYKFRALCVILGIDLFNSSLRQKHSQKFFSIFIFAKTLLGSKNHKDNFNFQGAYKLTGRESHQQLI